MWRFVLLILLVVAVAPLAPGYIESWNDSRASSFSDQDNATSKTEDYAGGRTLEIPLARNGQYMTDARLNGRDVEMLVDTGASKIALSEKMARRIGIFLKPSDYRINVHTANGVTRAASATVRELRLGSIRLKNVEAVVLKDGLLSVPLLGMSALGRLERFDISNDTLVLVQ